jgi:hypothetical protein
MIEHGQHDLCQSKPTRTTGRGGSGSPEAKAQQQQQIVRLPKQHGAS